MIELNESSKTKKSILFVDGEVLLSRKDGEFSIPDTSSVSSYLAYVADELDMGMFDDVTFHCARLSSDALSLLDEHTLMPLKAALESVDYQWFGILARASQLLSWQTSHKYCGRCGSGTKQQPSGFEIRCGACHQPYFPKISPSIIVMVKKENKILLARKAQFPPGVYALVAGFVEAGERLEDTVIREVYEETGIKVKNIQYVDSQPWPFPDSLMLAFTAEYDSGEIKLIDGELEHADWYSADNMPGMPSSKISIARKLIDNFINQSEVYHA